AGQAPVHTHPAEKGGTRRGLGIILVALYGLFALAATGRAIYQIIADFEKAPVAYLLSALAAVIYIVATVALARRPLHRRHRRPRARRPHVSANRSGGDHDRAGRGPDRRPGVLPCPIGI